jgi:hypothetical protein
VAFLHGSEVNHQRVHILLQARIEPFVLGLVLCEVNVHSHSWVSLLLNVDNMFGYFVNLRHHDDPLNYLFHDVRNFYNFLSGMSHSDKFIFSGDDWFIFSLDFVVDVGLGDQFLFFNDLVLEDLDFFDLVD